MSEKLDADVHLIKAVEQLDEELRPFIDAQLEARQSEEEHAASKAPSASSDINSTKPENPKEPTDDSGEGTGGKKSGSPELTPI